MSTTNLSERVSYVIDSSTFKQGNLTPGTNIPIKSPEFLFNSPPKLLFVACAGYNKEVVKTILKAGISTQIVLLEGIHFRTIG